MMSLCIKTGKSAVSSSGFEISVQEMINLPQLNTEDSSIEVEKVTGSYEVVCLMSCTTVFATYGTNINRMSLKCPEKWRLKHLFHHIWENSMC